MVTISDITSKDNPVAQAALNHTCGMCHVPAGVWCKPFDPKFPLATVVHYERATRGMDKPKRAA